MIKLKIFFGIFLLLLITSCQQNKQTDQTVTLSKLKTDNDISKNISSNLKIENQEKIDIDNSTESKTSSALVKQVIQDLNGDGIKDKIEVYKNMTAKDQFEQEHFSFPVIFPKNRII